MNREIKFRAVIEFYGLKILIPEVAVYPNGQIGFSSELLEKQLPKNYHIDWDSECIRHIDEEKDIFDNVMNILTGEDWIWLDDGGYALMQFTGLKDKNGKEIYEGDLLQDKEGRVFVIKWLDAGLQFRLCATELRKGDWLRTYDLSSFGRLKHLEIISNIHENPELLNNPNI